MRTLLILTSLILSLLFHAQAQRATVIKSPHALPAPNDRRVKIFLGGSIDMGKSVDWQAKLTEELATKNVILLNPRREDWNKDWKPVSTEPNFKAQVEWELSALEASDVIIMYFAPDSQSPISLLEFGLYSRTKKLMVVCPEGFWRKGNVDIVSERYHVSTYATIEQMITALKAKIDK
jgi:hypothetical protein